MNEMNVPTHKRDLKHRKLTYVCFGCMLGSLLLSLYCVIVLPTLEAIIPLIYVLIFPYIALIVVTKTIWKEEPNTAVQNR